MKRRDLLHLAMAAGASSVSTSSTLSAVQNPNSRIPPIIDTNVHLFRWPSRRLPLDETESLVEKLHSLGVTSAWVGSFDAILHRDLGAVNQRLDETCRRYRVLRPIGSINPHANGWERDLRQCHEIHNMPGIRIYPNYHGYGLNEDCFQALLGAATQAGLFVQIAASMEDVRTQHPMMLVADVDLTPLPEVVASVDGARVQLLNHRLTGSLLQRLVPIDGIYFDTARVDQTDGIRTLLKAVRPGRVVYGSHAPFLIPEAALIRVAESRLTDNEILAVLSSNATALAGETS